MKNTEPDGLGGTDRVTVGVGVDEDPDPRKAVRKALSVAYATLPGEPGLVILTATSAYELSDLLGPARIFTGPVPLIGGTSGAGLTTAAGVARGGSRGRAVAAMAISGGGASAGVGHADVGGSPRRAGEAAADAALASVPGPGGSPCATLVFSPPGHEESILAGVTARVGRGVPVFGCTVADAQLEGRWAVFAGNHILPNSVAVAVLYGSFLAGSAFSAGYWPTANAARATGVQGRMVRHLDGRPASEVYAEWLGVSPSDLRGGAVRTHAALQPLGLEEPRTRRLLIKEPGTTEADGSIGLFADVKEGDTLRLLSATPESLISAAGAAASEAMMRASLQPEMVRGVLMAQGAGRLAVLGERASEVPLQLRRMVGNAPILGMATLGEQSALADGRPVHLNLTVSVLAIGG